MSHWDFLRLASTGARIEQADHRHLALLVEHLFSLRVISLWKQAARLFGWSLGGFISGHPRA